MLIVCLWLFVAVDVALRLLCAFTASKYICVCACVAVRVCSECRLCVLGRQALQLQRGRKTERQTDRERVEVIR